MKILNAKVFSSTTLTCWFTVLKFWKEKKLFILKLRNEAVLRENETGTCLKVFGCIYQNVDFVKFFKTLIFVNQRYFCTSVTCEFFSA